MNTADNRKIIFIGGIHGVGKTTLCRKISEALLIKHYSASELISKLKVQTISKDKKVSNIGENQDILLESINSFVHEKGYYLLDGHFCLLNSDGHITEISFDTYKSLELKEIIVLVDNEAKICERLANRDKKQYSINLIKEFQEKEIHYAKEVAKRMDIRCKIINATDEQEEMFSFVKSILDE